MANVIEQETPVVNELPAKKDLKLLIGKRKSLTLVIASIFLFLVVLVTVCIASWLILNNNTNKEAATPSLTPKVTPTIVLPIQTSTPTPTPTPRPLPSGPQRYSVSSTNSIKVNEVYISALDTKIGDPQTIRLTIQDPESSVNSVSVKMITDNKSDSHSLSLTSGTAEDGVWENTWTTNDAHDYIYQAQITIKDQAGDVFSSTGSFR
jgi:hypothetical protein